VNALSLALVAVVAEAVEVHAPATAADKRVTSLASALTTPRAVRQAVVLVAAPSATSVARLATSLATAHKVVATVAAVADMVAVAAATAVALVDLAISSVTPAAAMVTCRATALRDRSATTVSQALQDSLFCFGVLISIQVARTVT